MTRRHIRTAVMAGAIAGASLTAGQSAVAQDGGPWDFSANIGAVSNYIWRGVSQTGDGAAVQGGLDVGHESGFYAGTWASNIDLDEGAPQEVIVSPVINEETGLQELDDDGAPMYTAETVGGDRSSPNYELDLYAGYDYDINDDLSVGISGIYYAYPDGRDSDFAEIGVSGSYRWLRLGAAYTLYGENDNGLFDDGDWYFFGSAELSLPYDFGFGVHAGYYDFRHDDVGIGDFDANGVERTESADYWHYGASVSKEAGEFGTFSLNWDQNSGKQDAGYDPDPKFWVGWIKEF